LNYKLRIPCSKNNLKLIREFVDSTLEELCVPESQINMMVLAIDEICANRIIHANKNNDQEHLEVKISDENGGILFEIKDKGEAFNINDYAEPSMQQLIDEKRKGGIGLILVRRIMDKVEMKTENGYTLYQLFKKL
jgi:serine/threonine-protein kinase RsbW